MRKLTKILLSTSLLASLGSLALTNPAFAASTPDLASKVNATTKSNIKKVLDSVGISSYSVLETNDTYTTIFNDKAGIITFFANGKYFTNGRIFTFDAKKGIHSNLDQLSLPELKAEQANFINLEAKNAKTHAFVYFNIKCPHCHHLISEYQNYLDAGISLTFIPLTYLEDKDEVARMSYILNAKPSERFKYLNRTEEDIPKAKDTNAYVKKGLDLGLKYGVNSYPHIVCDNGTSVNGYVDAATLLEACTNGLNK